MIYTQPLYSIVKIQYWDLVDVSNAVMNRGVGLVKNFMVVNISADLRTLVLVDVAGDCIQRVPTKAVRTINIASIAATDAVRFNTLKADRLRKIEQCTQVAMQVVPVQKVPVQEVVELHTLVRIHDWSVIERVRNAPHVDRPMTAVFMVISVSADRTRLLLQDVNRRLVHDVPVSATTVADLSTIHSQTIRTFATIKTGILPAPGQPVTAQVSALDTQVGGDHYKKLGMQPLELVYVNMGYRAFQGACYTKINKYLIRDKDDEVEQLKKARHVLDVWIEKAEMQVK